MNPISQAMTAALLEIDRLTAERDALREKYSRALQCLDEFETAEPVAWMTTSRVAVDGLWEEQITLSLIDDGGEPLYKEKNK